jgi:hypothetical protein
MIALGPIRLMLWAALAPLRVPLGVVFLAGELVVSALQAVAAVLGAVLSLVQRGLQSLPLVSKLALRGACLAGERQDLV